MSLIDLISEDVIKVPLVSTNKPDVLRELVMILRDAGRIQDNEAALAAIHAREEKGSTGLEIGIAVPHAKCDAVKTLTIAIGISRDGIDFDSADGKPSHLFFLLLAPPGQSGPHVEALSEIARLSKSPTFLKMLRNVGSAQEAVELLHD